MNQHQQHMPGLDGLRALACLMVFAVHFGQKSALTATWGPFDLGRLLDSGNTGVALFFILSGFLLSLPYWDALARVQPWPGVGRFYALRLARIAPAFYLCLVAMVVGNKLWLEDGWVTDLVLHAAFLANATEATTLSINPPFWTMAVEVQFYLLMPWLFSLVRGADRRRAVVALLVLALFCYGAYAAFARLAPLPPAMTTYSLAAHLPHFLLGMATAGALQAHRGQAADKPASRGVLAAVWGLLLVILSTPLADVLQLPHGRYNLPVVPVLLCLVVALSAKPAAGTRLVDMRLVRALGTVSYGVYLFHLPVLNVVARTMTTHQIDPQQRWLVFGLGSLLITLVAAALSHLLVERPVLRLVRRWLRP